ncbi:hypothetical protein C5167_040555 [Papaver somniferum]|uniref:Uncharacterized protein n=1 Tax=Papaver somniferum TaxID=3469 RepID=A0A4Y7IFD1_PAPSO|nr:hypothetical protein C5167_040555 [Papaver somniferum]
MSDSLAIVLQPVSYLELVSKILRGLGADWTSLQTSASNLKNSNAFFVGSQSTGRGRSSNRGRSSFNGRGNWNSTGNGRCHTIISTIHVATINN